MQFAYDAFLNNLLHILIDALNNKPFHGLQFHVREHPLVKFLYLLVEEHLEYLYNKYAFFAVLKLKHC